MHRILARKENVSFWVKPGANLRLACQEHGIQVYPTPLERLFNCRGKGLCGTCMVEVEPVDAVSPPTKREQSKLKARFAAGRTSLRLSCQTKVQGDLAVVTDPDKRPSWKQHPHYAGRPVRTWEAARPGNTPVA